MEYKNSKIYKLISNNSNRIYIGSTTQKLSKRKSKHKSNYIMWKKNTYSYVTSFDIIDDGDIDIILIEDYPCIRKEQLHARERHFIESLTCVNKRVPGRTRQEYRRDNLELVRKNRKISDKKYYLKNRDNILTKKKRDRLKTKVIKDFKNQLAISTKKINRRKTI